MSRKTYQDKKLTFCTKMHTGWLSPDSHEAHVISLHQILQRQSLYIISEGLNEC